METNILKNRTSESVYLEYVNDFITIEGMAEYYNISEQDLKNIIDEGMKINHSKPQVSMALQALQNAVIYTGITGLTIHEKQQEDKRKTISKYFLQLGVATISPVLDYTNMNHFLLGLKKGIELSNK